MSKEEFEKFYEYITVLAIYETDEQEEAEIKERFWKELSHVSFEKVMAKAKEVIKSLITPCNLNQLSPKVFSGENPNPGLYGMEKCEFYL